MDHMKSGLFIAIVTVCLSVGLLAGPSNAEMMEKSIHVSPVFGYYIFEGDQNLDNGFTAGLAAGYNFTSNWGFELMYNYVATEDDRTNGDADAHVFMLDGLYHFNIDDKLVSLPGRGPGPYLGRLRRGAVTMTAAWPTGA